MRSESCKSDCNGGVKVALGGGFAALCLAFREFKSQCNGGVKLALGGRFVALC